MRGRRGVQAEVLASLALVMVTANLLLAAFLFRTHAADVERLRGLVGRALAAEARSPAFRLDIVSREVSWWVVSADGSATPKGEDAGELGARGRSLAAAARRASAPLLETGAPWEPVRFAVRLPGGGDVAVARLAPTVAPARILALVLVDGLVFTLLGAWLLRHRVVLPLRRLAAAARRIAEGDLAARVVVEGGGEVAEVGWAFNEMNEALEARTLDLEKAVVELRETNHTLRQARDGLARGERLAAVGRLAAGVAHEVGNPMGAVLAFLELARRDDSLSQEARGHLERAAREGERVRGTLRQLLDFSRPPRAARAPVELRRLAEQAVALVRAQKPYAAITFEVEADPRCPQAVADESLVSQILLNLVLNAADAVRERDDARVALRLEPVARARRDGDAAEVGSARALADGVRCTIADNGAGVAEEDRERIFDPFFTTKPPGEGTGLGLPNALRLAEELGGALDVLPASPLGGAAFALVLPAAAAAGAGLSCRVRRERSRDPRPA